MASATSASRPDTASGGSSLPHLNRSDVERLGGLLVNRASPILRTRAGHRSPWFHDNRPLTAGELIGAILGQTTLGLPALGPDGLSRWVGIDVDDDDQFGRLLAHLATLPDLHHVYIEFSRRGGHVLLFHEPVPWHTATLVGESLALAAGIPRPDLYPSHAGLHALRCPGSPHARTGEVFPAIDVTTGELIEPIVALLRVTPTIIEPDRFQVAQAPPTGRSGPSDPGAFDDLVAALAQLTHVRVYGIEKAVARCPWHRDAHPSLFIKGSRFHCLSTKCRAWGDRRDVWRFIRQGVQPPSG